MAIMEGNDGISEITISLAVLLRTVVKSEGFITIQEEMKTVKDYLLIQSYRFEDKIQVTYHIEEEAYDYRVPNLILQPMVENAIIHGLEPKLGQGNLLVEITIDESFLNFCIQDDGVGMSSEDVGKIYVECESSNPNQSIGLKNVYRRLQLCYGEICDFQVCSEINKGTKIQFKIPIDEKIGGKL